MTNGRPATAGGRRTIPAAEVRLRMLRTAEAMVQAGGIRVSLEELSFEAVIEAAAVPRSSVYRLWPFKGDFIGDLLVHLAEPTDWLGLTVFDEEVFALAGSRLAAGRGLSDPAARRDLLAAVVREVVRFNHEALMTSGRWRIYSALICTVDSIPDTALRDRVAAALCRTEMAFTEGLVGFLENRMADLRYRPRAGMSTRQFAVATSALMQALVLRWTLCDVAGEAGARLRATLATPIGGAAMGRPDDEEWGVESVAYLALVDAFFEPVADSD